MKTKLCILGLCACIIAFTLPIGASAESVPVGFAMQPSVILRVDSEEDYTNDKMESASNVLVGVDAEMNIKAMDGCVLDSYDEFSDICFRTGALPFLRIEEGAEDAFIAYAQSKKLWDVTVLASDVSLKKIRAALPDMRGALDLRGEDLSEPAAVVTRTNGNFGRIAFIDAGNISREFVDYMQARFITVWTDAQTEDEMYRAIFSGAYGVSVSEPQSALNACKVGGAKGVLVRTPYLFGHRGVTGDANVTENSVGAFVKAVDSGATHVEMDLKLTADKKIVINHDDSLNTTSTGEGLSVSGLTLEEIKQHKLKDGQDIPTLSEVLEALCGKEVILILEYKTNDAQLIPLVREELERHDMLSRCVVISFQTDQLRTSLDLLPECPTLNLGGMSADRISTAIRVMCGANTGWGLGSDGCTYEILTEELRDRGFIAYGGYKNLGQNIAYKNAQGGMMHDRPSAMSKFPRSLEANKEYTVEVGQDTVEGTLHRYVGEEKVQCGYILLNGSLDNAGDKAQAVLTYTEQTDAGEMTYLSQTVTLTATGGAAGCSGSAAMSFYSVVGGIVLVAAMVFIVAKC